MNTHNKQEIETHVIGLEKALADPQIRRDPARMRTLISDDFSEIGRSGRRFDKASILQDLAAESGCDYVCDLCDFSVQWLSDTCIMLTYRSILNRDEHTWRTSIWCLEQGQWRVRHHQGTPTLPAYE